MSSEALSQAAVPVGEDRSIEAAQEQVGDGQARLVADAVGDGASAGSGLDRPFMLPVALGEHGRALEEAMRRFDLLEPDVVVVHGEDAEQKHP